MFAIKALSAGCKASTIVRSPGLAPPISRTTATPSSKASRQSAALGTPCPSSRRAARRRAVDDNGPELPAIARRDAWPSAAEKDGRRGECFLRQRSDRRCAAGHAEAKVAVAGLGVEICQARFGLLERGGNGTPSPMLWLSAMKPEPYRMPAAHSLERKAKLLKWHSRANTSYLPGLR